MTLLLENPWPAIVIGGIVEVILIGVLFVTGRLRTVVWMAVTAAIAGGLVLLEQLVVTDREQIETNLFEIAELVERGDSSAILPYISPSAKQTIQDARYAVSIGATQVRINDDLKITVRDDLDPPQAEASATVTIVGARGYSGAIPVQAKVWLRKVDGQWLIYAHERPRVGLR